MKTLIILAFAALTTACATQQPHQVTNQQVEISSLQSHSFCKGDKLQSYIETTSFTNLLVLMAATLCYLKLSNYTY